jgi:hypothetical protein
MQHFPSFHRNSSPTGVKTAREHLCEVLSKHYTATAAGPRQHKPTKGEGVEKSEAKHEDPPLKLQRETKAKKDAFQ